MSGTYYQPTNLFNTIPTAVPNNSQVVLPQITIPQPLQNYYTPPAPTAPNYDVQGPQLLRVKNGVDGAKQMPTVPNATYAIFEEDDDVFYVKVTDKNNYPVSLRRFRFYEEDLPDESSNGDYVTKEEYDTIKAEMKSLQEELKSLKEEKENGQQFVRSSNQQSTKQNRN